MKYTVDEIEESLLKLLPDNRYMDPPDGGGVSVVEQITRMIIDYQIRLSLSAEEEEQKPFCRIDAIEKANIERGIYAVVDIPERHPTDMALFKEPIDSFKDKYYTALKLLSFYGIDVERGLRDYDKYYK